MPLIILGGIYGGIFTPTEAAAVAIFYSLFVGFFVYKELKWKDVFSILDTTASFVGAVMLAFAPAAALGAVLSMLGVPGMQRLPQESCGDHVYGELGEGPKGILFVGHYDTVYPVGTLKTMPFKVEDGKAFGAEGMAANLAYLSNPSFLHKSLLRL